MDDKFMVYDISGKGYVAKGKTFSTFDALTKYYAENYEGTPITIVIADEATTAYWIEHWYDDCLEKGK